MTIGTGSDAPPALVVAACTAERGERVEQLRQALLPRALAGEVTRPGGRIRKIPFSSLQYIYARLQP